LLYKHIDYAPFCKIQTILLSLRLNLPMIVREHFSLRKLNTFGLDVAAKFFVEAYSAEDLKTIIADKKFEDKPKLILGGGSNVLFTKNFDGLVIHNLLPDIQVVSEDESSATIKAGSGVIWHDLVVYTLDKNLGGIENLSLIPGRVGAAPMQNIGAYGVELKDTFKELTAIHLPTGEERSITLQECKFGYRNSIFKNEAKGEYIITSVTLKLNKQPKFNITYGAIEHELKAMNVTTLSVKAVSEAVCNIRRSKLPDPAIIGNAGSFFKNPEIQERKYQELKAMYPEMVAYPVAGGHKLAAGWLIESAGWKGKQVGNVGMHNKQALVLVNHGNATAEELYQHALRVQKSVKEKFGVLLEMEVNLV
jgi:UDP-N-acetylmuramate dehydrogenase